MAMAIIVKPLAFLLFMAGVVIPIELALRRAWPAGPAKRLLFGRNFDKRHPRLWVVIVVGSYLLTILLVWAYLELRHNLP
jgi:hypothetical protein